VTFATWKTRIDGLDGILGGGVRYPDDGAVFLCIAGGPGTGKTMLALETIVRSWLSDRDGATFLYYSVEHTPESIAKKLAADFDWFGLGDGIRTLPQEVPGRLTLVHGDGDGASTLILTQARAASLPQPGVRAAGVGIEWILAEIENHARLANVCVVVVDNVGLLLTDLEYFEKRAALLETRRRLQEHRIHGIFVIEEAGPRDLRLPSAEEFSTDLMVHLSFRDEATEFKARAIEITKARHQYYYRGVHHFSIAGRGIARDVYLGARNERGPGLHVYPSVAAQLSMARDQAQFTVPARGDAPIALGHPELEAAFLNGTGPALRSSTALLAEPGTRSTYLALRFLAAGVAAGERVLMVSTREDRDAIRRICQREAALRDLLLDGNGQFAPRFRVVYLHPEFIAPGKFTWDLIRLCQGGHAAGAPQPVARMAFDNIYRLHDRFPLIGEQRFLIAAMLDMLRYQGITPLFVDMVPPSGRNGATFDPSPYLVGFDNVLHCYFANAEGRAQPQFRVLKSVGNDYVQEPLPIEWRRE
jgi:KaiC/GvpD/RAD55 family RecA-like ATPase